MNKNLQDLTWSILPKEFKEEVKKEYRKWFNEPWWGSGYLRGRLRILRELFGEHNLTSDSEGEEMLTVPRKVVMNYFREANLDRIYFSNNSKDYAQATGRKIMLVRLFGKDKCLPDDKADDKVSEKVSEENSSNFDGSEQKPPEPKYHKGEKVCYNGYVYEIEGLVGKNRYALKGLNFDLHEDMIEPYTEPDTSHETPVCENHSDNTSQKEANMNSNRNLSKDCDKQLDNILKDSFRNERRLNIATQIMSAILSNQMMLNNLAHGETTAEGVVKCIVDTTMMYTDALIAKCEEGGSDGN